MLSKERKGEIALLLLRHRFQEKGMHIHPETLANELVDVSKKIGIPLEDVNEFMKEIAIDLVAKTFKKE